MQYVIAEGKLHQKDGRILLKNLPFSKNNQTQSRSRF